MTELTFAQQIEKEAGGERIIGAVVGEKGWDYTYTPRGVRAWEAIRESLDYCVNDGYGIPECHAVYVWTETKVIFVEQYDGSTSVVSVPRFPVPCVPTMPGG